MKRYTITNFNADFPDDEACLMHVASMVYPTLAEDGTIPCRAAKCGGEFTKHYRLSNRKAYTCEKCGTHVYPLAGTIFEKSSTPLKSWFYAMYLMSTTRAGISAKQLERELGVTYKTAWRMFRQIRSLLAEDTGTLQGIVEVDETFIGGRPRHRQSRPGPRSRLDPTAQKPVVGMVERDGNLKTWVTDDVSTKTIRPLMQAHIMPAATVFTDDAGQYRLVASAGYAHSRINHSAKVYVEGTSTRTPSRGSGCCSRTASGACTTRSGRTTFRPTWTNTRSGTTTGRMRRRCSRRSRLGCGRFGRELRAHTPRSADKPTPRWQARRVMTLIARLTGCN